MITDKSNGKHYIGSAYGNEMIWNRWSAYVKSYHGGNKGLKPLVEQHGKEYIEQNSPFCIIRNLQKVQSKIALLYRGKVIGRMY